MSSTHASDVLSKKQEERQSDPTTTRRVPLPTGRMRYDRFHCFPRLPRELRDMVWKHTCTPRVVLMDWEDVEWYFDDDLSKLKVQFCQNSREFSTSYQIPISATCKESRQIFQELYKKVGSAVSAVSGCPWRPDQPIYMNFAIDTLALPDAMALKNIEFCFDTRIDTTVFVPMCGKEGLRYLTMWWGHLEELQDDVQRAPGVPRSFVRQLLYEFPCLKELTVIGNELMRKDKPARLFSPNPYLRTDCKLTVLDDEDYWELWMGKLLDCEKHIKLNFPAFSSIRLNVAALENITSLHDYDPYFIQMGPAEPELGWRKQIVW